MAATARQRRRIGIVTASTGLAAVAIALCIGLITHDFWLAIMSFMAVGVVDVIVGVIVLVVAGIRERNSGDV